MAEHYPRNTVSVAKFCSKCGAFTTWSVVGGRTGSCQDCIARLEKEADDTKAEAERRGPVAQQDSLFG